MCGIVGAISDAPVTQQAIEEMRDSMAHRGPDHAGIWLSEDSRICLGHRRLAIVDLTPEANQPFVTRDGRFVICFNGEIYNFQVLREELRARGILFHTRSDTEVLGEAFRFWGDQCLDRLCGMFAFAIWDTVERRLFCARDRAGEKPFYYALLGHSFLFASELKALTLWPGFRREIHYPALVDYLALGFVADPKSIWESCYKLPPGHQMSVQIERGGIPVASEPAAYWDMRFDPDYSVTDWGPRILETLQMSAAEMAFADVPVGTFLSGGTDSSSVTAALSKAGHSVTAFTIGFQDQDYDERPWARQVAQLYGTPHTERIVQPEDVTSVFRQMLWHYDEPFNDYSYLPTFYVCQEARQAVTVALSGDGGDELFAGYTKYRQLGLRRDMERFITPSFIHLLATGAGRLLPETSHLRRKVRPYEMDPATMMVYMMAGGFSQSVLHAAARGPLAEALKHYVPADAILPLLRRAQPDEVGLVNCMRYLDLKLTLAGDMLVKVDRASMAVSLEVRPVYLHRDMLTLAGRIPPNLLCDRNHTKKALKSALRAWLPDSVLFRKKMGFAMPLNKWLRGDLRQSFSQNHGENPLDELLDASLLDELMHTHASTDADLSSLIHSLYFLKHWLAQWIGD
jgi:asparagine synthase (glutamine-hydrolysing)